MVLLPGVQEGGGIDAGLWPRILSSSLKNLHVFFPFQSPHYIFHFLYAPFKFFILEWHHNNIPVLLVSFVYQQKLFLTTPSISSCTFRSPQMLTFNLRIWPSMTCIGFSTTPSSTCKAVSGVYMHCRCLHALHHPFNRLQCSFKPHTRCSLCEPVCKSV